MYLALKLQTSTWKASSDTVLCLKGWKPFKNLESKQFSGFPGGSVVKNRLPVQEMQVQSLGCEVPLEKRMATHTSILAWEIPCTEEPGRL